MSTYKIESNIPIPPAKSGRHTKFPFRSMNIGDSFFVPAGDGATRVAACNFSKRNPGYRLICRKEEGGIRVWRVEANPQPAALRV